VSAIYSNYFLNSLSAQDLALISADLKEITFVHGDVLAEAGAPIRNIYFPESGLISVVVELSSGDRLEAALVGRAGMLGAGVAFDSKVYLNVAIVQMPGKGYILKASSLIKAAEASETLRVALFRQEQYLLAQAQQTAACNAKHQIPARLSTWLLRVRDASRQEDLALTQEFLGQMLGVQRASISLVAAGLQDAGMIRYRRGNVRVTDLPKLEATACECYSAVRVQYKRLFPDIKLVTPA
jgi:CRP-like cAMP-binding protein